MGVKLRKRSFLNCLSGRFLRATTVLKIVADFFGAYFSKFLFQGVPQLARGDGWQPAVATAGPERKKVRGTCLSPHPGGLGVSSCLA
jgi:hypothetical protein